MIDNRQQQLVCLIIWALGMVIHAILSGLDAAVYIPGKHNITADLESRNKNMDTEWMLNPRYLSESSSNIPFSPSIDLFPSRLNSQAI